MQRGELLLHESSEKVIGKVTVKLNLDIPEQMMQMLVNDISRGVEKWQDKVLKL